MNPIPRLRYQTPPFHDPLWKIPTKKTVGVFFVNGWDGIISANIRNPIRSAYNSCRKRNPYKDRRKDRMNGQSRSGQIPSANELPLFVAIRAFPEYWGYLDLSSIFMGFSTIIYIHIPNFLELPQCSIKSPLNHHEIPLNPYFVGEVTHFPTAFTISAQHQRLSGSPMGDGIGLGIFEDEANKQGEVMKTTNGVTDPHINNV